MPPEIDPLQALGPAVAALDAENPTHEQTQQAEQEQQAEQAANQGARDWAMIPFMIGGLVCMVAPELKPVYSEERCLTWGQHANQVAEKYGWNSPSNMPELGLVASCLTFAVPTFLTLRDKAQQAKEGKEAGSWGKVAGWWAQRKAARAASKQPDPDAAGGTNGGQK